MTCSSSAPTSNLPKLDIPEPLISLVRLLAREAAAEFQVMSLTRFDR